MRDNITLYALQYQLKRNLRPFTREEIQQLPTGRNGVYVLWRKTGTEGRNECLYVGESTTCVRRRLLQPLLKRTERRAPLTTPNVWTDHSVFGRIHRGRGRDSVIRN